MEDEKLSIGENKPNSDPTENVSEFLGIRRRRPSKFDPQKPSVEESERKTPEDESTPRVLGSRGKDSSISNGLESKQKALDKKGSKQVKGKICSGIEKESGSHANAKVAGKKSVDSLALEGLRHMESDRKVHKSLDTFIRQTMGHESYMSFSCRPGDKPLQRIIEHQHAANKYVKSLKVDVDIRDGQDDNPNVEPHQADTERDSSGTKGGISVPHRNLQTLKNSVPQAVATFAAAASKNSDHLTDLPGWPLLSPSQVQLQKCEKCSREFFSSFNYRRHTRTHRRISHVDKVNQMDAKQIFASSKKYVLEDLSGEAVVNNLIAFRGQNNSMTLPQAYMKAGQDLLDILANEQRAKYPLFSQQILSVLDEASEKTFLCSQGDASKIGLEEKNLVASLGFIVEQALVKAWMADKDAEALRHQHELVKEEEAAQMKREKNVAKKKKKKKDKSRQKGFRERKVGATQLALSEENESVDDENPSLEIVEDNSPTASSASVNSSGLGNPLLEPLEMGINDQTQNVDGRDHDICGEDGRLLKSKDILSTHVTSRELPDFVDGIQLQQTKCDLGPFNSKDGEQCFSFPPSSKVMVEDQGGGGRVLEQDQSDDESRKRTPLMPYKEPLRIDYQGLYQRGGWVPDPRFQEGAQQIFYRSLRKPSLGIAYTSNNERGSSPLPGFYRGKPASLRGTAPFLPTQQWAKKAQTPTTIDHVKDGQEDESSREHDTLTSKSVRDLATEHIVLAQEIDVDTTRSKNRAEKEEFKSFEKKEASPLSISSVAKVVANSGGLNNISNSSFNLNVNLEDWPPLSDSHAAYYPKNRGMYSFSSYQYELNARSVNKLSCDRRGGHQARFESKVEGSIISDIPPIRGPVIETSSESTTIGLQKGIMIGSVSVPLGDYVQTSGPRLRSSGNRINTFLPAHQSYTAILGAPLVRYTRDPMTSTMGRQEVHEGINRTEFEDPSNLQVVESYRSPGHYRASSLRSTPSMNLNAKNVRRPTYPVGDRGERGILTKQPSWSSGPVRHLLQKVWRPVRLTGENASDPNPNDGTGIESSPIGADKKISAKIVGSEENIDTSPWTLCMQVQDMDISRVEACQNLATAFRAQVGEGNGALDFKSKKENALQNVSNCKIVVSNNEHVLFQLETSEGASVIKVASTNAYHTDEGNAMEQNMKCVQKKNDDTEKMDDKAYVETSLSHSAWIVEAIEFHLNRWNSSLKDPETITDKCEDEHPELQTTKWVDFMDSLHSIVDRSTLWKEDAHDPKRVPDSNIPTGIKNCSNLLDEQRKNAQNIRQKSSRGLGVVLSTDEEEPRNSSCCESESLCVVGSTVVGLVSGSHNQERGSNEGQIRSRCGSSCSDSSISSHSRTERRHWTCTVSTTHERLPEQRYMPKQGCSEEKISC